MRLRNLLALALGFRLLVGCHRAVEPRPPIARACTANSLVVLEGTLDDRPRIERIAKIAALITHLGLDRLLDDPDRRVAIGDPVRCADRTLVPQ